MDTGADGSTVDGVAVIGGCHALGVRGQSLVLLTPSTRGVIDKEQFLVSLIWMDAYVNLFT